MTVFIMLASGRAILCSYLFFYFLHKRTRFGFLCGMSTLTNKVHLVCSWEPLLSGDLDECQDADDDSCSGGVAAVAAHSRFYGKGEPTLVYPFVDKQSPFVQMHTLGWSVNRLILNGIFGWRLIGGPPSLLTQNSIDFEVSQRDISDLQTKDMPLLITNAAIPPSISWFEYSVPLFLDENTGLALMSVVNSGEPLNHPQIESTIGMLNYIARLNAEIGCTGDGQSPFAKYTNRTLPAKPERCWIPVVVFGDVEEKFTPFLQAMMDQVHKPALVIEVEDNAPAFRVPNNSSGFWVASFNAKAGRYYDFDMTLSENRRFIADLNFISHDLEMMYATVDGQNVSLKDQEYRDNILALREQANDAASNDPVLGKSMFMPLTRTGTYRRCMGGECEIGKLFTEAARWWAGADIAFTGSGGIRGVGWAAGDVKMSNIWAALPFPNNMCKGVFNGVSLFKLISYSVNEATFEGENTSKGDRLLQVSGLRIVFNKQLTGRRLISMEVWDKNTTSFVPVERLRLYSFVTDSYLCSAFAAYPELVAANLTAPGEVPGVIDEASLFQNVVGEYLGQLKEPFDTSLDRRLFNDTSATISLNLIQTKNDCTPGTYWDEKVSTCSLCPDTSRVSFLSERVQFQNIQGSDQLLLRSSIEMVNIALFDLGVVPKSKPAWLTIPTAQSHLHNTTVAISTGRAALITSGDHLNISLQVDAGALEPGTAQGTVTFGVLDGGDYPGCSGHDVSFEVAVRVSPPENLNQLGNVRVLGFILAGLVTVICFALITGIYKHRTDRVVTTMQPFFLVALVIGVLVMGLSLIPLSIDDQVSSVEECSRACMAAPWLFSVGFTVAMSALFSKLWRINKLFHTHTIKRMKVREVDVMAPFAILFGLNVLFLTIWTFVSPLKWQRISIIGEPWNTYGRCFSHAGGNDTTSTTMMLLVSGVNGFALLAAGYQAYKARNISDEFSESKHIGVALFSWFQLLLVGVPVLSLIDNDNPIARYLLTTMLVFLICISMPLVIFAPMILQLYRKAVSPATNTGSRQRNGFTSRSIGTTRISGLPHEARTSSHHITESVSTSFNEVIQSHPEPSSSHRSHKRFASRHQLRLEMVKEESREASSTGMKDDSNEVPLFSSKGSGEERSIHSSENGESSVSSDSSDWGIIVQRSVDRLSGRPGTLSDDVEAVLPRIEPAKFENQRVAL